jgi:hypothetical protein
MLNYNPETKVISMIAKDTGDLVIALTNYVLTQGDKVYFTINNELEKEKPLVEKVITEFTDNKAVIKLTSADTDLAPGTYLYDVQVNTVDGRVDTVLGPAKFKIAGGVRY